MNDNNSENDMEEDLFKEVETSINTVIPPLLKAILIAAGFNDRLTLSSVMENLDSISGFLDSPDGIKEVKSALSVNISVVIFIIIPHVHFFIII